MATRIAAAYVPPSAAARSVCRHMSCGYPGMRIRRPGGRTTRCRSQPAPIALPLPECRAVAIAMRSTCPGRDVGIRATDAGRSSGTRSLSENRTVVLEHNRNHRPLSTSPGCFRSLDDSSPALRAASPRVSGDCLAVSAFHRMRVVVNRGAEDRSGVLTWLVGLRSRPAQHGGISIRTPQRPSRPDGGSRGVESPASQTVFVANRRCLSAISPETCGFLARS